MNMKQVLIHIALGVLVLPIWGAPFTEFDGGSTVRDGRTNLIWQKCSNGLSGASCGTGAAVTLSWQAALAYCGSLNLGGRLWRLPSRSELMSIVDIGKSSPAIDNAVFPATQSSRYWSSTSYSSVPSAAWFVNFASGASEREAKTTAYATRCVATGP